MEITDFFLIVWITNVVFYSKMSPLTTFRIIESNMADLQSDHLSACCPHQPLCIFSLLFTQLAFVRTVPPYDSGPATGFLSKTGLLFFLFLATVWLEGFSSARGNFVDLWIALTWLKETYFLKNMLNLWTKPLVGYTRRFLVTVFLLRTKYLPDIH